jgi:hypothetical protein
MGCGTTLLGLVTCGVWFIVNYFLRDSAKARARALCSANCANVCSAVGYLGWNGTVHIFELASRPFALRFMLANRSRILNVDYDVLGELERLATATAERRAVMAAPRPVKPPKIAEDPDEQVFLEAVEKLERQKGSASRRAYLESMTAKLSSRTMREKLAIEASRIEVQAVLDKVDTLKTASAKRRHLTAALESLRADDIPDALQAREIEWLEQALASIDSENDKST